MEMSAWKNWRKQLKRLKEHMEMFDAIDEEIWDDLTTEQQEDLVRQCRMIANMVNAAARAHVLWGDEE